MTRALILSGGAFRGAVQVPVIKYLKEHHDYDAVYGVSVGSLNGVMFAQDKMDELQELWDDVDNINGFLSLKWYWPWQGFYSMKPMRKKLERYVKLEDVKIPFTAGLVSFTDGEYYNLCTDYMKKNKELWDSIEASSCMAPIMVAPEIKIFGKKHIGCDGGFRNIIPVPKGVCYDYLDVVTCTPLDRMKMKDGKYDKKDIFNTFVRVLEIFEDETFDKDILELQQCEHGEIRIFSPPENPGSSFDADRETIEYRFELGRKALENPVVFRGQTE
jgi:predicted acylesterase/phospholipase RssA